MRLPALDSSAVAYRLLGISALEVFFGIPAGPVSTVEIETETGVAELAKLFDRIKFPGLPHWDALVPSGEGEILVRTVDNGDRSSTTEWSDRHPLLQFAWDPERRTFSDPHDLYPILKDARSRLRNTRDADPLPVEGLHAIEAALLCSRFPFAPQTPPEPWQPDSQLPADYHRILLSWVLTGPYASRGLEILQQCGYLESVIPELSGMDHTDHSKEGHPEGNVWRHTVETLRYRKIPDLRTGLALLFHDSGKPQAVPREGRRFDRHAEIGRDLSTRILRRIGFSETIIGEVRWLVEYHMIPGALPRLPDHRRDPLMRSSLFPLLLEVYRCDLSSTYRGPENYYKACAVYRRFLKRNRAALALKGVTRATVDTFVE